MRAMTKPAIWVPIPIGCRLCTTMHLYARQLGFGGYLLLLLMAAWKAGRAVQRWLRAHRQAHQKENAEGSQKGRPRKPNHNPNESPSPSQAFGFPATSRSVERQPGSHCFLPWPWRLFADL
jgi:hypothetical protein